jgi:transcriptional regulator with XRE-family HTH domain
MRDYIEPMYGVLGQTMIGLRRQKGMSQKQVAQRMGVQDTTVTHYELANNRVRLGVFVEWCHALDVNPVHALHLVMEEMKEEGAE